MQDMKRARESACRNLEEVRQLHSCLTASSHLSGISNQTVDLARQLYESLKIDTQEKQA